MEILGLTYSFDGGDSIAIMRDGYSEAGVYTTAIYMHRTCAALTMVAAFFSASQLERLSQEIKKRSAWINLYIICFAVYLKLRSNSAFNFLQLSLEVTYKSLPSSW